MKFPQAQKLLKNKFILIIAAILLATSGYIIYGKVKAGSADPQYITSAVEKGTLIVSVSGTGQVSSSNQVDIKPEASGKVTKILVKSGQEVKANTALIQLNAKDALKTVRDAQASLQSAQLSLQKLKESTDALSVLQAQNSLQSAKDSLEKLKLTQQTNYEQAQETKQNAEDDLKKAYDDGFNAVSNAFLDLPDIITGLNDIINGYSFNSNQANLSYYSDTVKSYDDRVLQYRDDANNKYLAARSAYDKNFADYKAASRYSDTSTIESLISETYDTTKSMAECVKSTNNLIQFYEDKMTEHNLKWPATADAHLSKLSSYTGTTNSHLGNLLNIKNTIKNGQQSIASAQRNLDSFAQNNPLDIAAAEQSIKEKEASLQKLQAGPDSIDLASSELNVRQRRNALSDAQEKLADYTVKAPFDGVIASISAKVGDSASSGSAIATMIAKQQITEISLNEVDITKVKVGQKATLTFQAIDGLDMTGVVAEIDTIGTVTQGVVNYNVKITFDAQDDRIKPGMSVSAEIITDSKTDVLMVPNSAVKSQGSGNYVQIMNGSTPQNQTVEIGIANDSFTEITNGLKEGDSVVTQTITSSSQTAKTTTTNRSTSSTGAIRALTGGTGGRPPGD